MVIVKKIFRLLLTLVVVLGSCSLRSWSMPPEQSTTIVTAPAEQPTLRISQKLMANQASKDLINSLQANSDVKKAIRTNLTSCKKVESELINALVLINAKKLAPHMALTNIANNPVINNIWYYFRFSCMGKGFALLQPSKFIEGLTSLTFSIRSIFTLLSYRNIPNIPKNLFNFCVIADKEIQAIKNVLKTYTSFFSVCKAIKALLPEDFNQEIATNLDLEKKLNPELIEYFNNGYADTIDFVPDVGSGYKVLALLTKAQVSIYQALLTLGNLDIFTTIDSANTHAKACANQPDANNKRKFDSTDTVDKKHKCPRLN